MTPGMPTVRAVCAGRLWLRLMQRLEHCDTSYMLGRVKVEV